MKQIVKRHPFLLLFGTLQVFFSAPGQTFLISLFVIPIFSELAISQSLFAGIYSAATLLAALLLNPVGRMIDKYSVQTVVRTMTVLMGLGCFILAAASNLVTLLIGFFILRLIGQGVFVLTASTLMIKKFEKNRGKSLGIIMQGYPLQEIVYPFLALFLLSCVGWRLTYIIFGLSNILIMLPLQLLLLKHAKLVHGQFLSSEMAVNSLQSSNMSERHVVASTSDKTLKEALKDIKFYLILIASCLPPMVVTGLFFHQQNLYLNNGWAIELAASGFAAYAVSKAISSLLIGPVVDRHGPFVPFICIILMLGVGTFIAGLGGSTAIIFLYFIIIGAALGFSSPVMNVVWPHFYGTKHIGSIKGMVATYRNGVTALGPLPVAILLDRGISINQTLIWTAVGVIILSILPVIVWKLDKTV